MQVLRIVLARMRALFRRDATLDEIRDELQFHVQMRTEALERQGLDAADARRAAERRFGNLAVVQDRGYDVRGAGVLETVAQDVKYGARQLAQHPSFSLVAILTLALGIGVSTALFSVIDAALLRPLPYPHPEQLVSLYVQTPDSGGTFSRFAPSVDDIRTWRALSTIVSHVGAGRVSGFLPLIVDSGTPQRLVVADVTEDFLETYGVVPVLGRSIQRRDTENGAAPVALLGHAFWQRQFGGDPKVLGRIVRIQDRAVTIVGVLPAGFYNNTALWQATRFDYPTDMRGSGTPTIARLRSGVTLDQAATAFTTVSPPSTISGPKPVPVHAIVESMYDEETGGLGSTVTMLALAVGSILLIACVNVAGLVLARGATRDVELTIRASIGAGRGRLVRQLLTESVLLALAGAGVGVLLAYAFLDSLVAIVPLSLPANSPVTINGTVLLFALALSIVTALLFGLVPALRLSRAPRLISTMLSVGGRSGTPLSKRTGQWLIALEVALALVLIAGSALILRSFARLTAVDLGYDAANLLTLEVEPLDQSPIVRHQYYPELAAALRRLPEVVAAGALDQLALGGGHHYGFARADSGALFEGPQRTVLPGYFEAMGVHPVAGRLFGDADLARGDGVIISAAAARRYFHGEAVGRTLQLDESKVRTVRIIGVVPDIRHEGPGRDAKPSMYMLPDPHARDTSPLTLGMVFRLRGEASVPQPRLRQLAESLGPRVLVGPVRPAIAFVNDQIATERSRTLLLTLLGLFGLLLTLVGVFGVTGYAVARRTREIGVRVALGASPAQILSLMIRDAMWPVLSGLVAGLAATFYATKLIAGFLFDTAPHEPSTLIAAVILLGVAALFAAWLPARRATRVDAQVALRAE